MKAQELMQPDVITASPETSLAQAQRQMQANRIRHLPVVSDQKLVGLVTDRDLRSALPSQATTLTKGEINYEMETTPIATCMTRNVVVIHPDDDRVQGATQLLKGAFGCLPVVDGGQLLGILTDLDLLRGFLAAAAPAGERMRVKHYMRTAPSTVMPNDLVSIAYEHMHRLHIRHLPVISGGLKLVGIVTDRDIRQAGASTEPHLAMHEWVHVLERMTVNAIMTTPVQTVRGDLAVADAGQLFLDHKFGCLPVVHDDDMLEGILTVTDLLRAYVNQHGTVQPASGSEGDHHVRGCSNQ
jgi:acetoin utilization protein AcuB